MNSMQDKAHGVKSEESPRLIDMTDEQLDAAIAEAEVNRQNHVIVLSQRDNIGQTEEPAPTTKPWRMTDPDAIWSLAPLTEIRLTDRRRNILRLAGIETAGQLERSELAKIRGLTVADLEGIGKAKKAYLETFDEINSQAQATRRAERESPVIVGDLETMLEMESAADQEAAEEEAEEALPGHRAAMKARHAAWFGEHFTAVFRKKAGGGSKTIGADQITWVGNFEGKQLRIRTTIRTDIPSASFHTHSNARISYGSSGKVTADSQHVDAEVIAGNLDTAAMARLAAILTEADTEGRRVLVRKKGEPVRSGVEAHQVAGEPAEADDGSEESGEQQQTEQAHIAHLTINAAGKLTWSGHQASGDPTHMPFALTIDVGRAFTLTSPEGRDKRSRLYLTGRGPQQFQEFTATELALAARVGCFGFKVVDDREREMRSYLLRGAMA